MRPTPRPRPPAALGLALLLAACSSGSDLEGGGTPDPQGTPPELGVPDECGEVVEGSWFLDVKSLTGGPLLEAAIMEQNGCLVFAEQAGWRLSGPLLGDGRWAVEITRDGERVGDFVGQFRQELESPFFLLDAGQGGSVEGEPILEVFGHVNPAALAISGFDPPAASVAGGAEVEVQGAGFLSFGLEFVFDGRPATLAERVDDTRAKVVVPAGDMPESVDVTALAAEEIDGEPTTSFTLEAAFLYCDFAVATGAWDLVLTGGADPPEEQAASMSFGADPEETGDCLAGLSWTVDGTEHRIDGPVDAAGLWLGTYTVGGADTGSGTLAFEPGDPSRGFMGTLTLDAGGAFVVSGTAPQPEAE